MINVYTYVFMNALVFAYMAYHVVGANWQATTSRVCFWIMAVNGWYLVGKHLWLLATH